MASIVDDLIMDLNAYLIDSLETATLINEFDRCSAAFHQSQKKRWHIYDALVTSAITLYAQYWYTISDHDNQSPWLNKKINDNDVRLLKQRMCSFVKEENPILEEKYRNFHHKVINRIRTHRVHATKIVCEKFYKTPVNLLCHNKQIHIYRPNKHVTYAVDGDFTGETLDLFYMLLEKTILELNKNELQRKTN